MNMMKKFLFAIAAIAMAACSTSCSSDSGNVDSPLDGAVTTQTLAMTAKTCMKGSLVYDCDFNATLKVTYADHTLSLLLNNVKFAEKMPPVDFVIEGIKFKQDGQVYNIEPSSPTAKAGAILTDTDIKGNGHLTVTETSTYTVTGLKGAIDTENNVYNVSFVVNGTYEVTLSSAFNCSTKPDASSTQKSYTFQLSNEGGKKTLRLAILNVKFAEAMPTLKEIAAYLTEGEGCTINSTATGYTFECASVVPYYKEGSTETPMGTRTMTNVKGSVDLVNRKYSVQFFCYGLQVNDSGDLYL